MIKKARDMINPTKFVVLIFIILLGCMSIYAHNGEQHTQEIGDSKKSLAEIILPFNYIEEGKYFSAAIVVVFWVALFIGFYELTKVLIKKNN